MMLAEIDPADAGSRRYQREAAHRALAHIDGVHGISNELRLTSRPSVADARERIQDALLRDALVDASGITVDRSTATLAGTVHSPTERRRAEEAACITDVRDDLTVDR
jgi:osmotically-inducible protein OsmY